MIETNKIVIFYFSGTGNARNVTHWIGDIASNHNVPIEIIDISKLKSRKEIKIEENSMIGFCSPTHGFNFPPIMFHFLLRFPKSKKNNAFIVNTRAGMKMGKFFLPGLSGLAQILSALILIIKGYKIKGMYPVDLPSNWISVHPGIKPSIVDSIYKRRKKQTEAFAHKILNNGNDYKGLKTIIIDLFIAPIAFLYYVVGRFILAKTFYASNDCTNCNICIQKCPVQAIKLVENRPFWTYKCESCMQCMNICPERAIETAHGYVFAIYFFISSYLVVEIYKLLHINYFIDSILPAWSSGIFKFFIDAALLLSLYFAFYRIFHFLLRFRFFERIIVFTSLTKWKFWRRFKIVKRS
jgi:ferredoxin